MDETSQKIIDAAMALVRDKGYVATTTKEIARVAGVMSVPCSANLRAKRILFYKGQTRLAGGRM